MLVRRFRMPVPKRRFGTLEEASTAASVGGHTPSRTDGVFADVVERKPERISREFNEGERVNPDSLHASVVVRD